MAKSDQMSSLQMVGSTHKQLVHPAVSRAVLLAILFTQWDESLLCCGCSNTHASMSAVYMSRPLHLLLAEDGRIYSLLMANLVGNAKQ